jgi:transposase
LDKKQEKWAIFWCDLLSPVIYEEIEPELTNLFLKSKADEKIQFPDGRVGKPSLKTLRRKLNRYRQGGFDALARKGRSDRGKPRNIAGKIIEKAIELKKEQPQRSPNTINRFLEELYGQTVPRSTLYRHLKRANATGSKTHGRQKGVSLNFHMKNPTATSPIMMLIIFGSIKVPCQKYPLINNPPALLILSRI